MKKSILAIIIAITIHTGAKAQETIKAKSTSDSDTRKNIILGAKLGANYSNVYDSQGEDFVADAKLGFVAGGFVTIPLGKLFAIQPEVLYSQKGFKGSGTLFGSPYNYTRTTDYLDIPLFVAIRPSEYISILAGPQFSFLMSEKNEFTSATVNATQEQAFNNDNIRKNTFCLIGGIDVNIDKLVIGARAGWDLKTNNGDGTSDTPRYKNMWYQLTLGYKF
ncbi:porin family protein [Flavobacterium paronense]|uniref:Porin family protein n=1 Tax=Flavobacterium paronense TaxID=1392775 RepID=A0ABV5GG74_9FLAO|nr:porin family protein [Flavobacterium paronense]MDN3677020.1 porin family protein [Flavobacterium paronense]